MTDHGALYGAIDFYKEARERGIQALIGIEAYIALESRTRKARLQRVLPPNPAGQERAGLQEPDAAQHPLAPGGVSTTSRAWTRRSSRSTARASSPSAAPLGRDAPCWPRRLDDALKLADFFKSTFDDFYLEVMKHDGLSTRSASACSRALRSSRRRPESPRRDERLSSRRPVRGATYCCASAPFLEYARQAQVRDPRVLREVGGADGRPLPRTARGDPPTAAGSPGSDRAASSCRSGEAAHPVSVPDGETIDPWPQRNTRLASRRYGTVTPGSAAPRLRARRHHLDGLRRLSS